MLAPAGALAAAGSISGSTRDAATGAALGGVEVCAFAIDLEPGPIDPQGPLWCSKSGSDGGYRIEEVPPGRYDVGFTPPCCRYPRLFFAGEAIPEDGEPVEVGDGEETTDVDAEFTPGGQIEGRVSTAAVGTPVEGVEACAYLAQAGRQRVGCGRSGADGRYLIERLPEAEYKVEFRVDGIDGNLAPQMYGHRYSWEGADPISVAAESTAGPVDAALDPGAVISGAVHAAAGGPVASTRVCAFWLEENFKWACAHSDELGRYRLWKLPPKVYKVGFSLEYGIRLEPEEPESDGYLDQYSDRAATLEEAETIDLSNGGAADGVDALLVRPEEALVPPQLPADAEPTEPDR
jgi:hypothetical protein